MTDLTEDQVVEQCRTYWIGSGITEAAANDMAAELRSHIQEAASAGKTVDAVTGSDIDAFAEDWASASREPHARSTAAPDLMPHTDANRPTWGLWLGLAAIVGLVVAVALLAPKDESMNQAGWAATWLVAAAVLAVGEMLTAGFFLLPFAAGAAAAGILALLSVSVPMQIITFLVVSVLFLWLIQRFARKDIHGELLPVGAARYIGESALVIEPVNRLRGTGMVKLGLQDWRATTDGDSEIPADTEVRITEVRGARLVVELIT